MLNIFPFFNPIKSMVGRCQRGKMGKILRYPFNSNFSFPPQVISSSFIFFSSSIPSPSSQHEHDSISALYSAFQKRYRKRIRGKIKEEK